MMRGWQWPRLVTPIITVSVPEIRNGSFTNSTGEIQEFGFILRGQL